MARRETDAPAETWHSGAETNALAAYMTRFEHQGGSALRSWSLLLLH